MLDLLGEYYLNQQLQPGLLHRRRPNHRLHPVYMFVLHHIHRRLNLLLKKLKLRLVLLVLCMGRLNQLHLHLLLLD